MCAPDSSDIYKMVMENVKNNYGKNKMGYGKGNGTGCGKGKWTGYGKCKWDN